MSYGDLQSVRVLTGVVEEDVSDEELMKILGLAEIEVMRDLSAIRYREKALPLSETNRLYRVKYAPIVDRDGDGVVTPEDVIVEAKVYDFGGSYYMRLPVTSVDAEAGLIQVGSLPDAGEFEVLITYAYSPYVYRAEDVAALVNYRAAHLVINRLASANRLNLADEGLTVDGAKPDPERFLRMYERTLAGIKRSRSWRVVRL